MLIISKEDAFILTLKNAINKCGYSVKCCKNIEETHEAFKKANYDLVLIDSRRNTAATNSSSSNTGNNSSSSSSNSQSYDYENICRLVWDLFTIKKLGFSYMGLKN